MTPVPPFFSPLLQDAERFVFELYQSALPKERLYHTFSHSLAVVAAATHLGKLEGLDEQEMEALLISGWFHDVGHIRVYNGHEAESAALCSEFLRERHVSDSTRGIIEATILSTTLPQRPTSRLEAILCDADLYHLGSEEYETISGLLRVEWEKSLTRFYTDKEWIRLNIDFFEQTPYHTKAAQTVYSLQRSKNYLALRETERVLMAEDEKQRKKKDKPSRSDHSDVKLEIALPAEKDLKPGESVSDREFDSIYKTTSRNNVDFSQIADQKANLLIHVNATIISIFIAVFIRRLEEAPHFIIPTLILIFTCVATIIYAILSTRPNVTKSTDKPNDFKQKRTNLLFFGNYLHLSLNEYEQGIETMKADKAYLHSSMIRDNYFLGIVLGKKYRNLRISYTIFMYGLILSVTAFILSFWMYQ